jgi:hypothetical protein
LRTGASDLGKTSPGASCGGHAAGTALLVGLLSVTGLAASASWCSPVVADARRPQVNAPAAALARVPAASSNALRQRADAPKAASPANRSRRSPASAPLSEAPTPSAQQEAATNGVGPSPEVDPLVDNGLGSPLCQLAPGGAQLSGAGRRNCETSGFVAAGAPTGDYGIDVHIDTGVLGLSTGGLLSTVQELFVTPVWMALVWSVHALVVMLEWCFTLDLLDSASVSVGLARGLRQVQATFTEPWLATVLAIGSVLAAYNGLIRRRVAETVGQALLMLAMMAAGIWVMLDPVGTVGALGGWANQASLSTLAVTASGTPVRAGQALADSMGEVFATAVEVPWCYLEFGDVGWCRNPARLDPRLRAAALSIAAGELTIARCRQSSSALGLCAAPGSSEVLGLEHSARLLRSAHTNGAIFLAFPANGSQRNAIGDRGSLLWTICQSDNATACRGPTTAQAEFRTNSGTWARVAGLLLIVAGVLGMLLLLGFLALRLLAAALFSLLYLMLAPAAVLAPALGDGGRAVFRRWAGQLLAAVVSKLIFSFVLGAILAVLAILSSLEALGWWTQWLLMSAFWWGAFVRRHEALQMAGGQFAREERERRTLMRRAGEAFETPRRLIGGARAAKQRREQRRQQRGANHALESERGPVRAPRPPRSRPTPGAGAVAHATEGRAGARAAAQVTRTLQAEYGEARAHAAAGVQIDDRVAAMRAQLARVTEQHDRAAGAGDARRTARLAGRAARIEGELAREQAELIAARRILDDGRPGRGEVFGAEHSDARSRFLDAQAALAPSASARRRSTVEGRDYRALAGLAGYGRREYESLGAGEKRSARLLIDRELASRREARVGQGDWSGAGSATTRGAPVSSIAASAAKASARRHASGLHNGERASPGAAVRRGPAAPVERGGAPGRPELPKESESSVMRDAREVAARRKRQLGRDRP